jgi:hypothetical protein
MHHLRSAVRLCATLLYLAASGCAPSHDGGVSTGGSDAEGSSAMAGTVSAGGSEGTAGTSGGSTSRSTGGTTAPASAGGATAPASTGGATGPASTGGVTSPNTAASGGSGGATIASTSSSIGGLRDAGVGGSAGGGSSGNRDASPGGGTAAGGTGGKATGGSSTGGSATGGSSTGGSATGGSTGPKPAAGKVFSQCRFHFGAIDSSAKNGGATMISQLDMFTPGWMMGTFNQKYVCDEANGVLAGLVPVDVTYISANYVKNQEKLCDCNVSGCAGGDLCKYGAQYITQDWAAILSQYTSNSTGLAGCLGGKPIIFEMEPDWYQYTGGGQSQPFSPTDAGTKMTALVNALKSSLPNAVFSLDISPWVAPNNGSDGGKTWFSNFDMSLFTFVNTSGGGTSASTAKIRSANNMTWATLHQASGKPILADTGYGANGGSAGPDPAWDVVANINARIADGVVSITQYNPSNTWGSTISGIRSQLSTPSDCP